MLRHGLSPNRHRRIYGSLSQEEIMNSSEYFMREAVAEAAHSASHGYGKPFGAVVVRKGEIIGRGYNDVFRSKDPSSHAELNAIREACKK